MKNLTARFLNKIVLGWSLSILASLLIMATAGAYAASQNKPAQAAQKTVIGMSGYRVQPDDFRPVVRESFLVVEGIVKEVKPAVWTSPDGLPPADLDEAMQTLDIQLRTPILISITRAIKGNISGDLLFTVPGGVSDDYRIEFSEADPALVAGDRILVFLHKAGKNAGYWSKISPYYPEMYFLVRGDQLVGFEKKIQRSELEGQLQDMQEVK